MENKVIKAVSFEEAIEKAKNKVINNIPYYVIETINEMIEDKLSELIVNNSIPNEISFKIGQDDVVDNILKRMYVDECQSNKPTEDCRRMIFAKNWLDFEPLYREKGWQVEFEKILLSCERNTSYWIFKYNKI